MNDKKEKKILKFQTRRQEHQHIEMTAEQIKEIRARLFRGEIHVEEYYRQVHINRRGPCPNCGQYH